MTSSVDRGHNKLETEIKGGSVHTYNIASFFKRNSSLHSAHTILPLEPCERRYPLLAFPFPFTKPFWQKGKVLVLMTQVFNLKKDIITPNNSPTPNAIVVADPLTPHGASCNQPTLNHCTATQQSNSASLTTFQTRNQLPKTKFTKFTKPNSQNSQAPPHHV
jgi:hypothetical protein